MYYNLKYVYSLETHNHTNFVFCDDDGGSVFLSKHSTFI